MHEPPFCACSVGCIFYEMIMAKPIFPGTRVSDIMGRANLEICDFVMFRVPSCPMPPSLLLLSPGASLPQTEIDQLSKIFSVTGFPTGEKSVGL